MGVGGCLVLNVHYLPLTVRLPPTYLPLTQRLFVFSLHICVWRL